MSVGTEQLIELGSQPEASKDVAGIEERSRSIGSLAALKALILDYVKGPRFTNGLARAGESPDFHAVSTRVDGEGNIDQISRKINLGVFGGTLIEVVTHHSSEERLSRRGLEITKDNPAKFAEARRPLIKAGLEGEAVDDAIIFVSNQDRERTYSLNGDFMKGPSRAELAPLTKGEQEEAVTDDLLVRVQDHLRAPEHG